MPDLSKMSDEEINALYNKLRAEEAKANQNFPGAIKPDNAVIGTLKEIPKQVAGAGATILKTIGETGANLAAAVTNPFASDEHMNKLREQNRQTFSGLENTANQYRWKGLAQAATQAGMAAVPGVGPAAIGIASASEGMATQKKDPLQQAADFVKGYLPAKGLNVLGNAIANRATILSNPAVKANMQADKAAGITPNLATAAVGESDDISKAYADLIRTEGTGALKKASAIGEQVKQYGKNFINDVNNKLSLGLGTGIDDTFNNTAKSFSSLPQNNVSVFQSVGRPIYNEKLAQDISKSMDKLKYNVKDAGWATASKQIDDLERSLADPNITFAQAWEARVSFDRAIKTNAEGLSPGTANALKAAVRKNVEPRLEEIAKQLNMGDEFKAVKKLYAQKQVYDDVRQILGIETNQATGQTMFTKLQDPKTLAFDSNRAAKQLNEIIDTYSRNGKVKAGFADQINQSTIDQMIGVKQLLTRHRSNITANLTPGGLTKYLPKESMAGMAWNAASGAGTRAINSMLTSPAGLKLLEKIGSQKMSIKQIQNIYDKVSRGLISNIPSATMNSQDPVPTYTPPNIDFSLGDNNNGSN